jgi:hypothetical protein
MRAEVMEFYGLTRSPRAVGFYETAHHRRLLQDIKQAVYDGDLVALCGVVGAGKTVTLRRLQEMLARENRVIVSKSISIEKSRVTLGTLITALFCDLSTDKELKIPKHSELRDRDPLNLVRKRRKPIVLMSGIDNQTIRVWSLADSVPLAWIFPVYPPAATGAPSGPGLDLGQRCVRLLADQRQQPVPVLFGSLRPIIHTTRGRRTTAYRRQPLRPTESDADAHPESTGSTTARGALPNSMDRHEVLLDLSPGETRKPRRFARSRPASGVERIGRRSKGGAGAPVLPAGAAAGRLAGGVDPRHLRRIAAAIGVVGARQVGHGPPGGGGIGVWRHAEYLVPGEAGFLEPDRQLLGGDLRQQERQGGGPARHGGAAAAPVVDLAGGDAGEPGEGRLGDVGAAEQGGEFAAEERFHAV